MPCHKSKSASRISFRVSSQVFLLSQFFVGIIGNVRQVLPYRSPKPFLVPIIEVIPPCSHRSLYHTVSAPVNLYSFAQVTVSIINALLCLAKYSLLDKTEHPAIRCSIISPCPWHLRHLPFSISPRAAFQDLVSTICSNFDMIDDVFCR